MHLSADAPEGSAQAIVEALRELPGQIAEIRDYRVGLDVGVNPPSWDVALTADFDVPSDYVTYRDHPEHQRIIRELIEPVVDQRVSVQFPI